MENTEFERIFKSLIDKETEIISLLSNASAILNEFISDINWVGFYLVKDDQLILGPFQGKIACSKIAHNRGVCGKAFARKKVMIVDDVHKFSDHIACDSNSNSEIVVPIILNNSVYAVLDIDSPKLNRFDETISKTIINIAKIIELRINYIKKLALNS